MPLDPSIITSGQQPQPQNPLQTIGTVAALKNQQSEAALRAVQLQGAQQENQQRQMAIDQTQALNQAYTGALSPDGSIDTGKLTDALSKSGHGSAIPSILKGVQDYQKSAAETSSARTKAAQDQADFLGGIGATVTKADGNPFLAKTLIAHAASQGAVDPKAAAGMVQQIDAALSQDPTGETARKGVLQLAQNAVNQSPAQRKLAQEQQTSDAATATATARQQTSDTEKKKVETELPKLQADSDLAVAKDVGQKLSAVRSVSDYQRVFNSLSPADQNRAKAQGFTPPDQVRNARDVMAATKTAGDLTKSAHERTEETQGAQRVGIEAGNLGVAKQRLAVEQYNAGVDSNGKPIQSSDLTGDNFLNSLPMAMRNQVKAIAEGREPLPTGRTAGSGYNKQVSNAVNQYDPQFSTQRAQLRSAFTTGKQGDNIGALNTAVVHTDQYIDALNALKNGTFRPGNAAYNALSNLFGGAPPTTAKAIANAVAGETATALKGNATDQEIAAVHSGMPDTGSPEQIAAYAKSQLHVLGAKLNTYQERYNQQIPNDKVYSPVLPSAKAVFDKNGINPTAGPAANSGSGSASAPAGQFAATATGPNGHKIGYNGKQWVDVQTGKPVQ